MAEEKFKKKEENKKTTETNLVKRQQSREKENWTNENWGESFGNEEWYWQRTNINFHKGIRKMGTLINYDNIGN